MVSETGHGPSVQSGVGARRPKRGNASVSKTGQSRETEMGLGPGV